MRRAWTDGQTPLDFSQKALDRRTILSANDQAMVAEYEQVCVRPGGHHLPDLASKSKARRHIGNPLPP
jgi:hypothetical protein